VVCVPPDLAHFRAAQQDALADAWPATAEEVSRLDPASVRFREARLLGTYVLAHHPGAAPAPLDAELRDNLTTCSYLVERATAAGLPPGVGPALEVGCGPGGLLRPLARLAGAAVGLDLRLSMLRAAARMLRDGLTLPFREEGRRFATLTLSAQPPGPPIHLVQGDLGAPPFEAEAYSLVAALSLLDTVPDPLLGLGQLDALLSAGGLLVLASPHNWEPEVTPPSAWLSTPQEGGTEALLRALGGQHPVLPHLRYEVVDVARDLPWVLPGHRRLVHRYLLDVVLARKAQRSSR